MFYERITSHMQHHHQLRPGTPSFIRNLEQNQTRTEEWIEEIYQAFEEEDSEIVDTVEDDSENKENEEPESKGAKIQKYPEGRTADQSTEEGDDHSNCDTGAQKGKNRQSEKSKRRTIRKVR